MTVAPRTPTPHSRTLPLAGVHAVIGLIDVAFAAGEAAIRLGSLVLGMMFGSKALSAAIEGIARFIFFGNLWWPVLHAVCLVAVLARTRWGWIASAVLLGGRAAYAIATGSPYRPIANDQMSTRFLLFMLGLFAIGGVAQLWHGRPPTRARWEDDDDDA